MDTSMEIFKHNDGRGFARRFVILALTVIFAAAIVAPAVYADGGDEDTPAEEPAVQTDEGDTGDGVDVLQAVPTQPIPPATVPRGAYPQHTAYPSRNTSPKSEETIEEVDHWAIFDEKVPLAEGFAPPERLVNPEKFNEQHEPDALLPVFFIALLALTGLFTVAALINLSNKTRRRWR